MIRAGLVKTNARMHEGGDCRLLGGRRTQYASCDRGVHTASCRSELVRGLAEVKTEGSRLPWVGLDAEAAVPGDETSVLSEVAGDHGDDYDG